MKRLLHLRALTVALALFPFAGRILFAQGFDTGDRLFRLHCAGCHGLDGHGGLGPDLSRGEFRLGSSNEAISETISKGITGTPMPATLLSREQLGQLIGYIKSLAAGRRVTIPGNPDAGEKLFAGRGGCTRCHMVRGEGGSLGPDLTYIGSSRSPAQLRASILRPAEDISPSYWSVDAADKDGITYTGIRLNEDTYSIQIIDTNQTLHSLIKNNLTKLKIDTTQSRMPASSGVTQTELDDLVAYLYSLERKSKLP
jgi:putative heme-binding domain-containing protein